MTSFFRDIINAKFTKLMIIVCLIFFLILNPDITDAIISFISNVYR